MTPESFQEFYHGKTQTIMGQFRLARKSPGIEVIHEMRVEMKRLRAFFNLIEWINSDFKAAKHLKEIRRVFKAAGKIRDIHVQQELTMHWMKKLDIEVSEYYNHLKQQEINKQPQFTKACKRFKTNEFEKNWIFIRDALNILPQNYIEFKAEERFAYLVNNLIKHKNKDKFTLEDFHKIRIQSKEARYALEILQTIFPEADHFDELNFRIRDLHRALGKWHDEELGLLLLKDFIENYSEKPFYNRLSYDLFVDKLDQDKEKWLSTFEKHWKDFVAFLYQQGSFEFIETKFSLN